MPTVHSAILVGVDVVPLRLEAVCSPGFTGLHLLGLPSEWTRDARERARVALEACGQRLDERKVVVQVSCEASLKLSRSAPALLDFALCAVVLLALKESQEGKDDAFEERLAAHPLSLVGEVLLSGDVSAGASSLFCEAAALSAPSHFNVCLPPLSLASDSTRDRSLSFARLLDFAQWVARGCVHREAKETRTGSQSARLGNEQGARGQDLLDFESYEAKVVAAFPRVLASWNRLPRLGLGLALALAGRLHLFVLGSPGIGKTHAMGHVAELLPPLTARERIERRLIQCGTGFDEERGIRPFRAPQHTCTVAGLVGNAHLAPGEFTLAHRGALFLDEFLEFSRTKLEALREPLEGKRLHLARAQGSLSLPADFQLLAAANPCRCGHFLSRRKGCRCLPRDRAKAWSPLSGPLLDRFTLRFALTDEVDTLPQDPYLAEFTEMNTNKSRRDAFAVRLAHVTARAHGVWPPSDACEQEKSCVPFLGDVLSDTMAPNLRARVQWDALLTTADALFPEVARAYSVEERLAALSHLRDLEGILEHALLYETLPPKEVKSFRSLTIPLGCADRVLGADGASA
ncbi:MAG: ATP-binding protein [Silvanigrellales bacterium]|jgi:magnesium chelatase family protein|nr:ATP-binding protein [Silvanigrellales bacterium]